MNRSKITPAVSAVLLILALSAVPALADVTWNFTAAPPSPGPLLTGTITTPDPPFAFFTNPPSNVPVSGQLVIPPGILGGPGEVIGFTDAEINGISLTHDGTTWQELNFSTVIGPSYDIVGDYPFTLELTFGGLTQFYQIIVIEPAVTDEDGDGVDDADDVCPGTVIPESVPTVTLGLFRYALTDNDGIFDTRFHHGHIWRFTIEDTAGCSCEQIIDELHLGPLHRKFGCGILAMKYWVSVVDGL